MTYSFYALHLIGDINENTNRKVIYIRGCWAMMHKTDTMKKVQLLRDEASQHQRALAAAHKLAEAGVPAADKIHFRAAHISYINLEVQE